MMAANDNHDEQNKSEGFQQARLTMASVGALRAGLRNATQLYLRTRITSLTRNQELALLLTATTLLESVQLACANCTDKAALTLWKECQRVRFQVEARFDDLADHDAAYYIQPLALSKMGELDEETEQRIEHWAGIELA
jgi:hypothetical protein